MFQLNNFECLLSKTENNFMQELKPLILNIQVMAFYVKRSTTQPFYNMVHYNTVLDITRISVGPQLVIFDLFSYITIHFTLVITWFG